MSRLMHVVRECRAARELHRDNDIRWAIHRAVRSADRDELIEIAVRNDVRF
jgi:hypothetical protein